MRLRNKQLRSYTFTVNGEDYLLQPGNTLTIERYGVTIWAKDAPGKFEILAPSEATDRVSREIEARYGVKLQ